VFDKAISSSEAAYWQLKLMDSALYMDISVLNRKYDKEEYQTVLNIAFTIIYKQNHSFTLSYAI